MNSKKKKSYVILVNSHLVLEPSFQEAAPDVEHTAAVECMTEAAINKEEDTNEIWFNTFLSNNNLSMY